MYVKQTWQTGDVVTSAKLNHMEDGIAAASSGGGGGTALVFPVFSLATTPTITCDMTFSQIKTAVEAGTCVAAKVVSDDGFAIYPLTFCSSDYIGFNHNEPQENSIPKSYFIHCSEDGFEYEVLN